jgi:hypothetical protein
VQAPISRGIPGSLPYRCGGRWRSFCCLAGWKFWKYEFSTVRQLGHGPRRQDLIPQGPPDHEKKRTLVSPGFLGGCSGGLRRVRGSAGCAQQKRPPVISAKALLLFLLVVEVLSSPAENLPQLYAPHGELILAQFASAPFPHPKRADGHQYKNQFYPAKDHYSDSTVALFIPKGFRATSQVDFVVHFHGWKNGVVRVLDKYKVIEQLVESGRNAVLVVPQGPRNASDSFDGKLEDPDGFKRFMQEVEATLRQKSNLKKKDFTLGKIVLSGHSGGYQAIASILDRGGLTDHVEEVWLFDALYAQTDKFLAWLDRRPSRLINIYTEHGGTKSETEDMMARLKQRGTAFLAGNDVEASLSELRTNHVLFLYTQLPHDSVLDEHRSFRDFLKTSCLAETSPKSQVPNFRQAPSSKSQTPIPPERHSTSGPKGRD